MFFKKTFEFDVHGKTIGFKFGMLASAYFCEEEKITIAEMQKRFQNPTPTTAINCALCAARAYNESKGLNVKLSKAEVAEWLDEIGIENFFRKIYGSLDVYQDKDKESEEEKNGIAPIHAGLNGQ